MSASDSLQSCEEIAAVVGSEELRQVRRHGNDARVATVYLIRRLTDEKVTTLAKQFGGVSVAA
ncbi:MAG TPA: hypothetical protein VMM76_17685, partial [Pirellulaceae bacterium]|nr:hypothetical protein [Pirellulaceae bacterium]